MGDGSQKGRLRAMITRFERTSTGRFIIGVKIHRFICHERHSSLKVTAAVAILCVYQKYKCVYKGAPLDSTACLPFFMPCAIGWNGLCCFEKNNAIKLPSQCLSLLFGYEIWEEITNNRLLALWSASEGQFFWQWANLGWYLGLCQTVYIQ